MEAKRSSFKFIGYTITESHIKMPLNKNIGDDFTLNIIPSGIKKESKFYLTLDTTASTKDGLFEAKITIIGEFEFIQGEGNITSFFTCNAPAIMFPYIRAYISSLTALSGAKTITIPTLNLKGIESLLEQSITEE